MGCPHKSGDEVCATCAGATRDLRPAQRKGAVLATEADDPRRAETRGAAEDATAQTVRRGGEASRLDSAPPEAAGGEKIGRYVVQDVLGRGGMGLVYTAFDPVLNRKVAIKVLRARPGKGSHSTGDSTRLLREAQAMAQLSHPNVVPVFDFGVAGDDVYVAMALVEGKTLYDWVKETRPDWRRVLTVFLAAGRGLQAAHEAGLVHRDFKPTNVLLDAALQPRVTDFGLARSVRSTSSDEVVAESFDISQPISLDTPLTRAGQVMGSPGYMAPEQYDGAQTSPATDQYSFCVSLYESLYGRRPFKGPDLATLGALARGGKVPEPPRGSTVPPWIFEIVQKGLAPDPSQRHASMGALLDALARDPAKKRQKWAIAAGGGLVVVGAVAGLFWNQLQVERSCLASGARVETVWGPPARARAEAAFVGTGRSWAKVAWKHAGEAMDAYAQAWAQARAAACMATRVRKEETEHHLALRNECLDRQLDEVATLAQAFASADVTLIGQASSAVARLSPVSRCTNLQALESRARVAPKNREAWERVQREVAQGRLLVAAGRLSTARERLDPAVNEAAALAAAALLSEAWEAKGELERSFGKYSDARTAFERAAQSSLAAGDDVAAARQVAALVSLVGWRLEKPAEGLMLASIGRGLLERIGGDRAISAGLEEGVGDAQWQSGDRTASLVSYRKALDALVALHGTEHLDVARLKSSIGWVLNEQGQVNEARVMLEESHGVRERLLGPDHPELAETWKELATLANGLGDPHEAVRCFEKSLAIHRKNLEPDSPRVTRNMVNLAEALIEADRAPEAVTHLAVARQNLERMTDHAPSWTVHYLRVNARSLSATGRHAEAEKEIEEAVRISSRQLGASHPGTAGTLRIQGQVLLAAAKDKEALAAFERFLALAPKLTTVNDPDVPSALVGSAQALQRLGRTAEAIVRYERALGLYAPMPGRHRAKAEAQLGLAEALWGSTGDRARARELGAAAEALFGSLARDGDARRARAWLDERTLPQAPPRAR